MRIDSQVAPMNQPFISNQRMLRLHLVRVGVDPDRFEQAVAVDW